MTVASAKTQRNRYHARGSSWCVLAWRPPPSYPGGLPAHARRLARAQWLRAAKRGYPKLFSGSSFLLSPKSMTIWVVVYREREAHAVGVRIEPRWPAYHVSILYLK